MSLCQFSHSQFQSQPQVKFKLLGILTPATEQDGSLVDLRSQDDWLDGLVDRGLGST